MTTRALAIAQPDVPLVASATELAMKPVRPASFTSSEIFPSVWSAISASTSTTKSENGKSQMKMRYARAAPRTLPPIDASRRSVRQPISATGSNGPHVVARCASAIRRARVRSILVSATGRLEISASWAARDVASGA